jgi:hypothetical protein
MQPRPSGQENPTCKTGAIERGTSAPNGSNVRCPITHETREHVDLLVFFLPQVYSDIDLRGDDDKFDSNPRSENAEGFRCERWSTYGDEISLAANCAEHAGAHFDCFFVSSLDALSIKNFFSALTMMLGPLRSDSPLSLSLCNDSGGFSGSNRHVASQAHPTKSDKERESIQHIIIGYSTQSWSIPVCGAE